MHSKTIVFTCALILGLSFSSFSAAGNWQWLKDSPIMSLDEQDLELLSSTIEQLLENDADGDSRQWHNQKTGNSGEVKVMDSQQTEAGKCRRVIFSNSAKQKEGNSRMTYCQQPDGQWKIDNRKVRHQADK